MTREEHQQKQKEIRAALNTPAGETILAFLEDRFYHGRILGKDPQETAFNCGAREVVCHLREIRNLDREV